MRAGTTIRVRGEGGAEWDQDVPPDGSVQRELLEGHVAAGRIRVLHDPDADADGPGPERPPVRAPKEEWVTWAVAADLADRAEANGMTKAELQALGAGEQDVDPGEGGSDVGADALVDEEGTEPEQVVDGEGVGTAGQGLDGSDGIVGQGA